jgi:hypothetical protein
LLIEVAGSGNGDDVSSKKLGWWLKNGTGRVSGDKRLMARRVGSGQKEHAVVAVGISAPQQFPRWRVGYMEGRAAAAAFA